MSCNESIAALQVCDSENAKLGQESRQPSLAQIVAQVWADMEAKGFHAGRGTSRDDTLVRLCLVHTEVSEAAQVVKRHWAGGPRTGCEDNSPTNWPTS